MDNVGRYVDYVMSNSTPYHPYWVLHKIDESGNYQLKWSYDDGVMTSSFMALYKTTGNVKYLKFVDDFFDIFVHENGTIVNYQVSSYNIDHVCNGYVLFDLYKETGKAKYQRACELLRTQLLTHPRTIHGSFWHKKIYPNQVWLDGLYMGQPFYAKYLKEHQQGFEDVLLQFRNARKFLFSESKKLYFHGYDDTKSIFWCDPVTGHSKNFWSRAVGWHLMALIETIEITESEELVELLKETIDGVIPYLSKNHMIYQVVDRKDYLENYEETSGSSMLAYAMLKGYRLGVLEKSYYQKGKQIFDGIVNQKLVYKDNKYRLEDTCLVAGLGPEKDLRRNGTVEYYLSEKRAEDDPKGVGPFILAYNEILRSNNR